MAEDIYTTPNMTRNTQGEREEGIEDNYDSIESLRDLWTMWGQRSPPILWEQ